MVDSLEKRELYKDLINKYGEKQVIVAIEELSELQKELCKNLRGRKNQLALTEEIADVLIMVEQMIVYFGIAEVDVMAIKQVKLERTKRLFNEE
jgi:NTP pyrophosphatase (non-canonical NTP hydrolase)